MKKANLHGSFFHTSPFEVGVLHPSNLQDIEGSFLHIKTFTVVFLHRDHLENPSDSSACNGMQYSNAHLWI